MIVSYQGITSAMPLSTSETSRVPLRLRRAIRVGRRLFLVLLILVNRVLPFRTLQLDSDVHRRLVDFVIFPKCLESGSENLNPQLAVGHAVKTGLALRVRLELKATPILLVMLAHRVHDYTSVSHRLAVVIPHDHEVQHRHGDIVLRLLITRLNPKRKCSSKKYRDCPCQ